MKCCESFVPRKSKESNMKIQELAICHKYNEQEAKITCKYVNNEAILVRD